MPDTLLMFGCVMFHAVISFVLGSWFPVHRELFLCDVILCPVVAHVDSAGPLLLDVVIGNSRGCGIVDYDWRWWLWESQVMETGLFLVCASFCVDRNNGLID